MQQCFINKIFIILYLQQKEMKVRINTIVIYFVIGLSLAMLTDLKAQPLLSWEKLSDVNFDLVWFEEHQSKFMVPRFGAIPNSYKNKKVKIKGYVIPVDSETIVELEMKKGFSKRYNTDDVKTFQGVLTLNTKDVMHFIYILKDAVEVSTP